MHYYYYFITTTSLWSSVIGHMASYWAEKHLFLEENHLYNSRKVAFLHYFSTKLPTNGYSKVKNHCWHSPLVIFSLQIAIRGLLNNSKEKLYWSFVKEIVIHRSTRMQFSFVASTCGLGVSSLLSFLLKMISYGKTVQWSLLLMLVKSQFIPCVL